MNEDGKARGNRRSSKNKGVMIYDFY